MHSNKFKTFSFICACCCFTMIDWKKIQLENWWNLFVIMWCIPTKTAGLIKYRVWQVQVCTVHELSEHERMFTLCQSSDINILVFLKYSKQVKFDIKYFVSYIVQATHFVSDINWYLNWFVVQYKNKNGKFTGLNMIKSFKTKR